jgi:hypothetical protein
MQYEPDQYQAQITSMPKNRPMKKEMPGMEMGETDEMKDKKEMELMMRQMMTPMMREMMLQMLKEKMPQMMARMNGESGL